MHFPLFWSNCTEGDTWQVGGASDGPPQLRRTSGTYQIRGEGCGNGPPGAGTWRSPGRLSAALHRRGNKSPERKDTNVSFQWFLSGLTWKKNFVFQA